MTFEEVLKLYNYEQLDHRKIRNLPYLKPLNYSKFNEFLNTVYEKDFCINVDNDGDGAVSAKLLRYLLIDFGANSVKLYYQNTPHLVEDDMIEFCKSENSTAIVLDSSCNNIKLMASAEKYSVPLLIIDHHDLDDGILEFYEQLTYTTVITSKVDLEELRDMSCGMYIYFLMHHYYMERGKLANMYFDLAVLSLASDVCPMDKPFHREIMKKYLNNTVRNQFLSTFTSKFNYFTKSLLSMTIAPTINALFRTVSYETLHKLLIDDDLENTIKFARDIYKHNKRILATVLSQLTIYDYGNVTYANIVDYPKSFIAKNYTGLLANKILERYRKPCIVTCGDNINDSIYKGSIRSNVDLNIHDTLKDMSGVLKFGGHTNAHGFTILSPNIENLIYTFNDKNNKHFEITSIPLDSLFDINDYLNIIDDIATFNEYTGSNVNPIGFRYTITNYDQLIHEKNYSKLISNIELISFHTIKPGDIVYIVPTISGNGVQFIANLI